MTIRDAIDHVILRLMHVASNLFTRLGRKNRNPKTQNE